MTKNKLTRLREDGGHYVLPPQRGCFERCENCFNLSEADSIERDGRWRFVAECEFCVQRLIDLLGWYEHRAVPTLNVSAKEKTRKHELGGIYEAIMASIPSNQEKTTIPIIKEGEAVPKKYGKPFGQEPSD